MEQGGSVKEAQGRAQSVFQHLATENQVSLELALAALKMRFEHSSQKNRYQAELQVHWKKKTGSCTDLAEDLCLYLDKVYPDLEDNAKETLDLSAYLELLDNPYLE